MEREEGGGQGRGGSPEQGTDREANRPSDRDRDPQQGGKEAGWVAASSEGTREQGGQSDEREEGNRGGRGQARR